MFWGALIIVENCFRKGSLNSSYFGYNIQLVLPFKNVVGDSRRWSVLNFLCCQFEETCLIFVGGSGSSEVPLVYFY